MAKQLLVPFDGSEQARRALEHAFTEHASKEITALYVLNPAEWGYGSPSSRFGKRWYDEAKEESEETQSDAAALADEHGVEIATAEEIGVPSDVIIEYTNEADIDHIAIGSHTLGHQTPRSGECCRNSRAQRLDSDDDYRLRLQSQGKPLLLVI